MLRKYHSLPFPDRRKQPRVKRSALLLLNLYDNHILCFIRWKIEHIVCSGSPIHCLMKWERCPPVSIVTQSLHLFAHQIREDCSLLMGLFWLDHTKSIRWANLFLWDVKCLVCWDGWRSVSVTVQREPGAKGTIFCGGCSEFCDQGKNHQEFLSQTQRT